MRRARGFTLIEMMVVIGLVALLMGGIVMSARSVAKSDLRRASSQLASSIRFLFDKARTSGSYYRLVIDLDQGTYWAEQSDDRFYLLREKEKGDPKKGSGPREEEADARNEAAAKNPTPATGVGLGSAPGMSALSGLASASLDDAPVLDEDGNLKPGAPKAIFKAFKESTLKTAQLKGVKIADVYTPKQRDPYTSGRAYVYFFPQGFGERAIVHLSDGKNDFYSLVIHPLTGRVVVQSGYVEIPKDFDQKDDEGNVSP